MKRWIGAIVVFLLALISDLPHNIAQAIGDKPFGITVILGGGKDRKVHKDQTLGFVICIEAYEEKIENLHMSMAIPPEVKLLEGVLVWDGELNLGEEKCLNPLLKSQTEIENWSGDVKAHMEFIEGGKIYMRVQCHEDWTWGPQGYKDSGTLCKKLKEKKSK